MVINPNNRGNDMAKMSVIKAESAAKNVIHLFGRDESGGACHIKVQGFKPYFYVSIEDAPNLKGIVDKPTLYQAIDGEQVVKVLPRAVGDIYDLRQQVRHHYEADVLFTNRFLIDKGISTAIEYSGSDTIHTDNIYPATLKSLSRVCYLDIECDDSQGFPVPKHHKILCISVFDSFDAEYMTFILSGDDHDAVSENHIVLSFETEKEMLAGLFNYLKQKNPDIITGWNVANFDIPYLKDRMEHLGIDPGKLGRIPGISREKQDIRGRVVFDLLPAFKKLTIVDGERESYRLDSIAKEELGFSKIERRVNVWDLWRWNPEELIKYNLRDVEICRELDIKRRIIEFFEQLSGYVGCCIEDSLYSTKLLDMLLLRQAKGRYVLPSKKRALEPQFEGALIFEPAKGLQKNVVVLDIKSLYPMAMMTLNASPETKDPKGELVAPTGARFRKTPDGLFKEVTLKLLTERSEKRAMRDKTRYDSEEYILYDLQQNAVKIVMNSLYGASAHVGFRLFDGVISAAITSTGRKIIRHTKNVIESYGFEVVYGDTDSTMVKIDVEDLKSVLEIGDFLASEINSSYDSFAKQELKADEHWFSIKLEKIYKRYYQVGKKRYAGLLVWKEGQFVDKTEIVGYELKRSNYPRITKETQQKVFDMMLNEVDPAEIKEYVSRVITKIRRGEVSLEDIAIPRGIKKDMDEYLTQDEHIRGARYANEHFGEHLGEGSKPKKIFIKTVTGDYPQTDVVSTEYPGDLPSVFIVNYELMMEKTIRSPIEPILQDIGLTWADVDPTVKTLSDFGL